MSIIHNTEPYTELSLFIEENLTKLVKYKLITRDRYKLFDQLISDYLLADSFGDEERKQLYAEQIEDHYSFIAEKLDKCTEEDKSLCKDPVVFGLMKKIVACSGHQDILSFIPDITPETSDDEFLDGFTNLMLKTAEDLKGEPLSAAERDMITQKIADGSFMHEEENYNNAYYHYSCPDYSSYAKQNRLSKPMTFLAPDFENDDADLDDTYEAIFAQVEDWPQEKLVKNITKLVYLHLSEWQKKSDDTFMYGLRAPLALIEHFHLHECLPQVLEVLRQDYEFQETYFMEDGLEDMLAAVLSNIIEVDDLPVLLEFMKQPGLLFTSKRQVALAVGHLPKRDVAMLKSVQQWLSDVLYYYCPMGADTDVFDEMLLDTLVYCCIHCNAVGLKPFIIKLYTQYKIPYFMVGGGCNEMRQKIKKAPLGTLEEESAEQMLLDDIACNQEYDDEDDFDDWENADEEEADPNFNIEDYDWQEFSPHAIRPKAVYKLVREVRKYTLRISLNGTKPSIWRELVVPSNLTLSSLASVILLAMGWDEDHLHQFVVGKSRKADFYATSIGELESRMSSSKDGRKFCIGEILCKKGDVVCFEYDYGDSWQHTVKLISSAEYEEGETKEIILTGGERACPPEDCGGIPGYLDICEAMKNPTSAHAQEMIEWMGCRFDPELFPLKKAQAIVKKCNLNLK